MTTYLLDANILIALATRNHAERQRCATWAQISATFALCPITQGTLVRYLLRVNRPVTEAQATLRALEAQPNWVFWPDDASYATADLGDISGHQQATDAYLAALARAHGAKLATMDIGLAVTHPDVTTLIP